MRKKALFSRMIACQHPHFFRSVLNCSIVFVMTDASWPFLAAIFWAGTREQLTVIIFRDTRIVGDGALGAAHGNCMTSKCDCGPSVVTWAYCVGGRKRRTVS